MGRFSAAPGSTEPPLGRGRALARIAPLVAIFACSAGLFALVTRNTHPHDIDSGPYLSMARHLALSGFPLSSFNFLGNFERLPGVPNFVAPGLSMAIAPVLGVLGDPIAAGMLVMFLSLVLCWLFAWRLLLSATGDPAYAWLASACMMCGAGLATRSASILSDLPFIACTLGALLAATRADADTASRGLRWLVLPLALALPGLVRFLGIFLPPIVILALLIREGRHRRAAWGHAIFLALTSSLPLAAYMLLARRDSPALTPLRPPGHFGWLEAVSGAAGYLGEWLLPWLVVAGVLASSLLVGRASRPPAPPPKPSRAWLPGLCAVAYVALLVLVRTSQALYPLQEIGARYVTPAWPLAFLGLAIVVHERVWRRSDRVRQLAVAIAALAIMGWELRGLARHESGPPFPTFTTTYRAALQRIEGETVVLANHGQPLVVALPDARVIGIPSRHDFHYEAELPDVVEEFSVEWIVLFPHTGYRASYPAWYDALVRGDTRGIAVRSQWRFRDGLLYRLRPSATTRPAGVLSPGA